MGDRFTKTMGVRLKPIVRYKGEVVAKAAGYDTFADWFKSLITKEINLYEDKNGAIPYPPADKDRPS